MTPPKNEDRRARWKRTHPWVRYVEWARRRCNDTKSKWFKFYGAKGVTCTLTCDDAEYLWKRDRAADMIRPSLDRIDPTKGYSVENCRFLEFNLNSRIAWDPTARPEPEQHEEEMPFRPDCHDAAGRQEFL